MKKYSLAGIIAAVIIILDQVTKIAVRNNLELWSSKTLIPDYFNLVYVVNKGAAFGFLNRGDISWQRTFFIVVTIISLGAITMLLKSTNDKDFFQISGLGFILGGAIGNLIDRILYGEVTDFLDIYVGTYHWPAFNVADIAICLGALAMIISIYRNKSNAPDTV
ncbi:signal peptidase II [Maridesulfovibrio ferrireducens]|uniref:Lipoprotein signal peptidase n=1 Tax=Maridesulfovibrio ferrireducens TaxID=246191 RepID=A0A1G9I6F3_9BACT|nr:signal peptidase II [Maridesulfovibrio ferrireducens]SDL20818.1 signal peptidase II [Maridesulfovibrio ferrireducens]